MLTTEQAQAVTAVYALDLNMSDFCQQSILIIILNVNYPEKNSVSTGADNSLIVN